MNTATWARVRALFEEALDAAPADIDAWLSDRETDPEVRAEVRSLLDHHARAGGFLEAPIVVSPLDSHDGPLHPGAVVGSYTVIRELGRGGAGRVYLASDARLGRQVALKALAGAHPADPMQRERFRREARAAAALAHPGICAVYALEEVDGELFIASEYIEGATLRDEIAAGVRPSADVALRTARELASALATAHARGITHRDLKPENVMRTADGRLKILDFGIAHVSPEGGLAWSTLTEAGPSWLGTPAYMAPEQLNGRVADARSDVFALGLLLYELTCGMHPFQGATPLATAGRILEAEPAPLASRAPGIPPVLAAAVDRCLRKDPDGRFASAGEVLAALEASASRIAAAPAGRSRAWWRTHQFAVIGLYATTAVVAWHIKEWQHVPATLWAFLALASATAAGGVVRGHLLFTERQHAGRARTEQRRVGRPLEAIDVVVALVLLVDAILLAPARPVAAALTMGLALGVALAAVLIEPTTSAAAFDPLDRP